MIALGSDHGGWALKQEVMKHLDARGLEYKDYGTYSEDSCDYPVYGKAVAHAVADGECEKGIIICGTGIGISITANKVKGIRAALCGDCFSAEMTRLHNDANILAMGASPPLSTPACTTTPICWPWASASSAPVLRLRLLTLSLTLPSPATRDTSAASSRLRTDLIGKQL